MEKMGVIKTHTEVGPWLSNVALVPEDNNNVRVSVNLHFVNKVVKDKANLKKLFVSYPLAG